MVLRARGAEVARPPGGFRLKFPGETEGYESVTIQPFLDGSVIRAHPIGYWYFHRKEAVFLASAFASRPKRTG